VRIAVIGGGPGGLYFAYLWKRRHPDAQIDLFEQNAAGATWGFGVVFSEQALGFLRTDDPDTVDAIAPRMESLEEHHPQSARRKRRDRRRRFFIDRAARAAYHSARPCALGRCHAALRHAGPVGGPMTGYDLVVAADGLNSLVRRSFEGDFGTSLSYSANKFAWYGSSKRFETLSQTFVATELGTFNAHHYRYSPGMSTFLVECDLATWQRYGFADKTVEQSKDICERVFAATLDGHSLVSNKSVWRNFPWIWNERWSFKNMALIGDALHSAALLDRLGHASRDRGRDRAGESAGGGPRHSRSACLLPSRAQADREETGDRGANQRRLVREIPRAYEAWPDGFCL